MTRFIPFNANPDYHDDIDCTIRAISVLMGQPWEDTYIGVVTHGLFMHRMPSVNLVWNRYLERNGYYKTRIPDTCPMCYTVEEFCYDHPEGRYLLALDGHVVAVVDGYYYDTWDSGKEVPLFYWRKE